MVQRYSVLLQCGSTPCIVAQLHAYCSETTEKVGKSGVATEHWNESVDIAHSQNVASHRRPFTIREDVRTMCNAASIVLCRADGLTDRDLQVPAITNDQKFHLVPVLRVFLAVLKAYTVVMVKWNESLTCKNSL